MHQSAYSETALTESNPLHLALVHTTRKREERRRLAQRRPRSSSPSSVELYEKLPLMSCSPRQTRSARSGRSARKRPRYKSNRRDSPEFGRGICKTTAHNEGRTSAALPSVNLVFRSTRRMQPMSSAVTSPEFQAYRQRTARQQHSLHLARALTATMPLTPPQPPQFGLDGPRSKPMREVVKVVTADSLRPSDKQGPWSTGRQNADAPSSQGLVRLRQALQQAGRQIDRPTD